MSSQIVEHAIYKAILGLTEYEQVYPNALMQTITHAYKYTEAVLDTDDKLHLDNLIANIRLAIKDYFVANPQFKRISKGVVIDMFAYYSIHFKSQYKNVYIERQVSYTAELYLERLIGYFAWLRYTHYAYSDIHERIIRYNARERKHVNVEDSQELRDTINSIYKSYMLSFKSCSNLSKEAVLGILYTVHKQYFPAP